MMLFLRGSDIRYLVLGLLHDNQATFVVEPIVFSVPPEAYVKQLQEFLLQQRISFRDLTGLVVVVGPGSATALRTSLVMMNTLAFVGGLPIFPVTLDATSDHRAVLIALTGTSPVTMVQPIYEHEPRITVSKKDALRRM